MTKNDNSGGGGGAGGNSKVWPEKADDGSSASAASFKQQQYNRLDVLEYVERLEASVQDQNVSGDVDRVTTGDERPSIAVSSVSMQKPKQKKDTSTAVNRSSKATDSAHSKNGGEKGASPELGSVNNERNRNKKDSQSKTTKRKKTKTTVEAKSDTANADSDGAVEKTSLLRSDQSETSTPGAFPVALHGSATRYSGRVNDDDADHNVDVENPATLEPEHARAETVSHGYTLASTEPIVATLVEEDVEDNNRNGNGIGGGRDQHDSSQLPVKAVVATASPETSQSFWKSRTFKILVAIVVLLVIAIVVIASVTIPTNSTESSTASEDNSSGLDVNGADVEVVAEERTCPVDVLPFEISRCSSDPGSVALQPDDKSFATEPFDMREWKEMTVYATFQNDASAPFTVTSYDVWTGSPNGDISVPDIQSVPGYPPFDQHQRVQTDETFTVAFQADLLTTPCNHNKLFVRGNSQQFSILGPNRVILLESVVECS